jgi:hypothetical protein
VPEPTGEPQRDRLLYSDQDVGSSISLARHVLSDAKRANSTVPRNRRDREVVGGLRFRADQARAGRRAAVSLMHHQSLDDSQGQQSVVRSEPSREPKEEC